MTASQADVPSAPPTFAASRSIRLRGPCGSTAGPGPRPGGDRQGLCARPGSRDHRPAGRPLGLPSWRDQLGPRARMRRIGPALAGRGTGFAGFFRSGATNCFEFNLAAGDSLLDDARPGQMRSDVVDPRGGLALEGLSACVAIGATRPGPRSSRQHCFAWEKSAAEYVARYGERKASNPHGSNAVRNGPLGTGSLEPSPPYQERSHETPRFYLDRTPRRHCDHRGLDRIALARGPGGREAARRAQCVNNLKQLGLGVLNYESTNGCIPPTSNNPTVRRASGKPTTSRSRSAFCHSSSWRAFNALNQAQVSTSAQNTTIHNVQVKTFSARPMGMIRDRRPAIRTIPNNVGLTRAIAGSSTTGPLDGPAYKMGQPPENSTVTLASITDGTSNTAIFSEWIKGKNAGITTGGLDQVYNIGIHEVPGTDGAQVSADMPDGDGAGLCPEGNRLASRYLRQGRGLLPHHDAQQKACWYGAGDNGNTDTTVVGASFIPFGGRERGLPRWLDQVHQG